jgi:superfamily I DNA/RNA helicase
MIALTSPQQEAVDTSFDTALSIEGTSGTGKTTALIERARRAQALAEGRSLLVLAPNDPPLAKLRAELGAIAIVSTTAAFAVALIQEYPALGASGPATRVVDDVVAEDLFAQTAEPLLGLEWPEFAEGTLDPEVPGLSWPERFLDAAFRLMRKLRDAQISPEAFLQSAQQGATGWYAKPPNLANPALLHYTSERYRNSLNVTPAELQRQFRYETSLAKILAGLYRAYVERRTQRGLLTPRDAIAEATALLRQHPHIAQAVRARTFAGFVDEAQELNLGELALLQAVFGDDFARLTIAGDPNGATGTFRGARPDRVFPAIPTKVVLTAQQRSPLPAHAAVHRIRGLDAPTPSEKPPTALRLYRARDQRDEARFIADDVAAQIRAGTSPDDIALIFRSVSNVRVYEQALLERGVATQVIGDVNLYADPRAQDALALLWNVHDPFRHDWLLRTLAAPAMALSDASLATLCGEPPDAQTLLFESDEEMQPNARARWDVKRDLRLGWNVVRGEADSQLTPLARERVQRIRALREAWLEASKHLNLPDLALTVWRDGLGALGAPGSAPERTQRLILRRLTERMRDFCERRPDAGLGDFLEDAQMRALSDFETCEELDEENAVRLISVEAARGREFAHVIVPNAHPGAFPCWYVPDSFLYSPSLGMIAKDNVGDARAARTAKFTYYIFRAKVKERYNEEERRAFAYALSRATTSLLVTASGRTTRGISAPEFLEELVAARLPGTAVL